MFKTKDITLNSIEYIVDLILNSIFGSKLSERGSTNIWTNPHTFLYFLNCDIPKWSEIESPLKFSSKFQNLNKKVNIWSPSPKLVWQNLCFYYISKAKHFTERGWNMRLSVMCVWYSYYYLNMQWGPLSGKQKWLFTGYI